MSNNSIGDALTFWARHFNNILFSIHNSGELWSKVHLDISTFSGERIKHVTTSEEEYFFPLKSATIIPENALLSSSSCDMLTPIFPKETLIFAT